MFIWTCAHEIITWDVLWDVHIDADMLWDIHRDVHIHMEYSRGISHPCALFAPDVICLEYSSGIFYSRVEMRVRVGVRSGFGLGAPDGDLHPGRASIADIRDTDGHPGI